MIGIIDYGAGNLASVKNAFERIGEDSEIVSDPLKIKNYSRIVLPGVGSFAKAMQMISFGGWKNQIIDEIHKGKPFLGICLGMQLLFEEGQEGGNYKGLEIFKGTVKKLDFDVSLKIPHVGWNRLFFKKKHPVLEGIKDHIDFYFIHSFECIPKTKEVILTETNYGSKFVSAVSNKNVIGIQFHPEKSQPAGLKILQNFSNWDGKC